MIQCRVRDNVLHVIFPAEENHTQYIKTQNGVVMYYVHLNDMKEKIIILLGLIFLLVLLHEKKLLYFLTSPCFQYNM